jgi:hypothetical protein
MKNVDVALSRRSEFFLSRSCTVLSLGRRETLFMLLIPSIAGKSE